MSTRRLASFNLQKGRRIGSNYEVEEKLGGGIEGEVYRVRDRRTGIVRAAKLFFPHRDRDGTLMARQARKLEALSDCPIIMKYFHSEEVRVGQVRATAMISAYSPGLTLRAWLDRQRGKRVRSSFVALMILHRLASGIEDIHDRGEYHADVHSENILIRQIGVDFELKLIDFYDWGRPSRAKQQNDILESVRVLHDMIGGARGYRTAPQEVRDVCRGLRHDLILRDFPTIGALRAHLEDFEATEMP